MTDLSLPKHLWWPWDQPAGQVCFHRDFTLTSAAPARLYVSASGIYRAWLDGAALQTPVSHLPSWRAMDIFTLQLASGPHRLFFEASSSGNQQPFLMACLDWQAAETACRLATDGSWWMAADHDGPIPLRPAPEGEAPGPGWRPAWAFDGVWAEPWGLPCNAPDDFCRLTTGWQAFSAEPLAHEARLYPGVITLGSAVESGMDGCYTFRPPLPYPTSLPKLDLHRPRLEWYRTREAHSLVNNTWLDLFERRCPHAVFDAGAETFARLKVRLRSGGPAFLAVTTGESLNEVDRYARRVTDLFRLEDGESFSTAPTGFRYVKVMVLSAGGETAVLEPVEVQHIRYPVQPLGRFRCSEADLNAIFDLSVRTLHLCMQTEIWDGIKRDQLPWMGDLYTEALAAYFLFGDYRLARRSLAVLAEIGPGPSLPLEEQRYPGLTAIWKTAGGDINDIPAYTLWWLVGVWDYWQYSGDLSLVRELSAELTGTIQHIAGWVDPGGFWRMQSGWDFVDWAPLSAEERAVYSHLLACRALRLGADLLEAIGQPVEELRRLHQRMVAAARQLTGSLGGSHHTHAQAITSGILSPAEAEDLFATTLQADPPLSMTYWHRYLDLTAALQVGAVDWGLAYIRRHWGLALQVGMTTLWEAFDPAWIGEDPHAVSMIGVGYARYGGYETSLCHGWSSGPAIWLMSAVLGVTPSAPGFARFTFSPNLGDLDWAEGTIPTPHGSMTISLARNPGSLPIARVQVPDGVEMIVAEAICQQWRIQTAD